MEAPTEPKNMLSVEETVAPLNSEAEEVQEVATGFLQSEEVQVEPKDVRREA